MKILRLIPLVSFLWVGCGSDNKLICTGASCSCPQGTSCNVSQSSCGSSSCSLACIDHNTCSGSCGQSCSANCAGGSTCNLTVGPSGSVSCTGGATCHVACSGSCSVSCSGASTNCDLKCASDSAPRTVSQTAQCT